MVYPERGPCPYFGGVGLPGWWPHRYHARNEGEDSEVKLQSCQTDLSPPKTPRVCVYLGF